MINPTKRYRNLLVKAEVLSENDQTIIDPTNKQLQEVKGKIIVLQQGAIHWYHWSDKMRNKVKFAITPNLLVYKDLISKGVKTFLLEFPIDSKYKIDRNWNERLDAVFYHGRIIPGKVNLEDLKKITHSGVKVVMRGPVCKYYWTDEDILEDEYCKFREEFMELAQTGRVDLQTTRDDEDTIVYDLNWHKFYFSLSSGEAFNVALQEAIACGTVPIVRSNEAYWWAKHLLVNFNTADELIKAFHQYKNEDLDEYSFLIANEIKARCSLEAIHDKYEYQKENDI